MKYTHLFETTSAFTEAYENNYAEPWVSYTEENRVVKYNKSQQEKLLGTPFTIEALESGTIQWNLSDNVIEYSMNGGEWDEMDSETTLTVASGDVISFRGNNDSYYTNNPYDSTIYATCSFNVYGNIMSLINSTGFESVTTIPENNCFSCLFGTYYSACKVVDASNLIFPATTLAQSCYMSMFLNCTSLISAPSVLPATTLAENCYNNMFNGCTSLTTAPALPATTLAENCYESMFAGCTSLTSTPELPATTLADYCYGSMFYGCTSLTTAPELPATTLVSGCYGTMFDGCTHLNYIKCLATDISASICTSNWVYGVSATGTFVKSPSMSSWPSGYDGIPDGWSVVDAS